MVVFFDAIELFLVWKKFPWPVLAAILWLFYFWMHAYFINDFISAYESEQVRFIVRGSGIQIITKVNNPFRYYTYLLLLGMFNILLIIPWVLFIYILILTPLREIIKDWHHALEHQGSDFKEILLFFIIIVILYLVFF